MNRIGNWQQLAAMLKQPQWIAVILSLGFHGTLFAAGPSFSSLNMNALGGDVPEQERRQVPLIELTPEEQSRLPDFDSSPYDLMPEGADPFELFSPSGSSLPLNSLPDAATDNNQPTPRPKLSPDSDSVAVGIAPYSPPRRPSSLILPRRTTTPFTPLPSGPTFSNGVPVPQVNRTPTPPPETTPSPPTTVSPDEYDGPTASDLALNNPDGAGGENESIPLNPGNGEPPTDADPNPLQAQLNALAYRPEDTTDDEAEAALAAWQAELEEQLPGELALAPDPIEMQLSYVQRLCLDPEPSDGRLGLLALPTAEGDDLELFPTVLQSTGYPFLNQEAIAALQDLKTPAETEDPEAAPGLEPGVMYQVMVNVDYDQDTCISREALLQGVKENQEAAPAEGDPTPEEADNSAPAEAEEEPEPAASPGAEALREPAE